MLLDSTLNPTQAQNADEERTKRAFIGFLSSALGVDQSYTSEDAVPSNQTGQYTIANPDGTVSVLGQPVSNAQRGISAPAGIVITPGLLLVIGLVLYLAS